MDASGNQPDHRSFYLQKFRLYETRSNFYMIGRNKSRTLWRVLKIDRLEPLELNISEDSTPYSETECSELLKRIHEGNKSTGGLKFVIICYGIVGFIKFLGPYYMLLITKRRKIGVICGHEVYAVSKSEMIPLPNASVQSNIANTKNENRSYVHSTCKCEMLGVLLKRFVSKGVLLKRVVFKLCAYPVYSDIKLFKCEILSCYFSFQLSEMNHLESKANRHFLCSLALAFNRPLPIDAFICVYMGIALLAFITN